MTIPMTTPIHYRVSVGQLCTFGNVDVTPAWAQRFLDRVTILSCLEEAHRTHYGCGGVYGLTEIRKLTEELNEAQTLTARRRLRVVR